MLACVVATQYKHLYAPPPTPLKDLTHHNHNYDDSGWCRWLNSPIDTLTNLQLVVTSQWTPSTVRNYSLDDGLESLMIFPRISDCNSLADLFGTGGAVLACKSVNCKSPDC